MNKFAGINFQEIDIGNASWDQIQELQNAFIKNFRESGLEPKNFYSPEKIIKHIDRYVKINFTPTINIDQKMALAIHYFPDGVQNEQNVVDASLVSIKKILATPAYTDLNINQLELFVKAKKKELAIFADDWEMTVQTTVALASKRNIDTALGEFLRLMRLADAMTTKSDKGNNNKLHWLSLQFIYTVAIMEYFSHIVDLLPEDEILEYAYLRVRVSLEDIFNTMDAIINGEKLLSKYILNSYFAPRSYSIPKEFKRKPGIRKAASF